MGVTIFGLFFAGRGRRYLATIQPEGYDIRDAYVNVFMNLTVLTRFQSSLILDRTVGKSTTESVGGVVGVSMWSGEVWVAMLIAVAATLGPHGIPAFVCNSLQPYYLRRHDNQRIRAYKESILGNLCELPDQGPQARLRTGQPAIVVS